MAKDADEDSEELQAACRHLNAVDEILLKLIGHYVPEMDRYIRLPQDDSSTGQSIFL